MHFLSWPSSPFSLTSSHTNLPGVFCMFISAKNTLVGLGPSLIQQSLLISTLMIYAKTYFPSDHTVRSRSIDLGAGGIKPLNPSPTSAKPNSPTTLPLGRIWPGPLYLPGQHPDTLPHAPILRQPRPSAPGRAPGAMHACLCACAQTLLFMARVKGIPRFELEPTGASLLGNASSSPPGSCLAWRGPSWQAQQPRSPGGQGEGMAEAGSSLFGPRPWGPGQWRASLRPAPAPSVLVLLLLSLHPQREFWRPSTTPPQAKTCRAEQPWTSKKHTHQEEERPAGPGHGGWGHSEGTSGATDSSQPLDLLSPASQPPSHPAPPTS